MRLLLEQSNVNVNSKDEQGQTPLARAAEVGESEVVRLLLARSDVDSDTIHMPQWENPPASGVN